MTIDEDDLREALDSVDKTREILEDELLMQEEWIPAAHRADGRLSIDLQTMAEDLSDREFALWKLGRVEARGRVLEELGEALLDGEYELDGRG